MNEDIAIKVDKIIEDANRILASPVHTVMEKRRAVNKAKELLIIYWNQPGVEAKYNAVCNLFKQLEQADLAKKILSFLRHEKSTGYSAVRHLKSCAEILEQLARDFPEAIILLQEKLRKYLSEKSDPSFMYMDFDLQKIMGLHEVDIIKMLDSIIQKVREEEKNYACTGSEGETNPHSVLHKNLQELKKELLREIISQNKKRYADESSERLKKRCEERIKHGRVIAERYSKMVEILYHKNLPHEDKQKAIRWATRSALHLEKFPDKLVQIIQRITESAKRLLEFLSPALKLNRPVKDIHESAEHIAKVIANNKKGG